MSVETSLSATEKEFLFQLYHQTEGDQTRKVDTAVIGKAIGIDKTDSRKISEELIGYGFISVKTLSGGIGITAEGLAEAERLGGVPKGSQPRLDDSPVITSDGRKAVEKTLAQIKESYSQSQLGYEAAAELLIDIKTIEVQLLSPKPKRAIVKTTLESMLKVFEPTGAQSAQHIIDLIGPPE